MNAPSSDRRTVRCAACDLEIQLPVQLGQRPLACPVCRLQLVFSPRPATNTAPPSAAAPIVHDFELGQTTTHSTGIDLEELLQRAAAIERENDELDATPHAQVGHGAGGTRAPSPAAPQPPSAPQTSFGPAMPLAPVSQPLVATPPLTMPQPAAGGGPMWPHWGPSYGTPTAIPPAAPAGWLPAPAVAPLAPPRAAVPYGHAVQAGLPAASPSPTKALEKPVTPVAPAVIQAPPAAATDEEVSAAPPVAAQPAKEAAVLTADCAQCGRTVRAAPRLAGRRVKCPQCGQSVSLPRPGSEEQPQSSAAAQNSVLSPDLPALIERALQLPPPASEPMAAVLSAARVRKLSRRIDQGKPANATRAAIESASEALRELCESRDVRAAEVLATHFAELPLGLQSQALKQAAELRDPQLLSLVLPCLLSTTEPLLRAAVLCLGGLGDGRAVEPLIALAIGQPEQRIRVLSTLQRMNQAAHGALLQMLQPGADPAFTAVALEALGQMRDPACIPAIARLLRDPSRVLRHMAAEQLAQFDDRRAAEALAHFLTDPDELLRLCAARAVARTPHPRYLPKLLRLLNDTSRDVRLATLEAIGGCGDVQAAEHVRQLLDVADDELVIQVAETLGRLGDESSVTGLIERLEAASGVPDQQPLTLQLVDALRRIGDPRALLPIGNLLSSPSPRVRARAAEAVSRFKDAAIQESLEDLLRRDPVDEVRAAAAKALGELGQKSAGRVLASTGLVDVPAVRLPTLIALGRLKDRSVLECLDQLTSDSLPQIHYQLTHVLEELADPAAIPALTVLACDGEEMVRRGARRALQALGDTRSEKELQKAARRSGRRPQPASSHSLNLVTPRLRRRRSGFNDLARGAADLVLGSPVRWLGAFTRRSVESSSAWGGSRILLLGGAVAGLVTMGALYSQTPRGMVLRSDKPARGNVSALASGDGGRRIVAGRTMRMIEVWDASTRELLDRVPDTPSTWIACSADGRTVLAADANCVRRYPLDARGSLGPMEELSGHSGVITQFAVAPDSRFVATVDNGGTLIRWSLTGAAQKSLSIGPPPGGARLSALALSPGGETVACAYSSGRVSLWSVETQQETGSSDIVKLPISALAFSPEGQRLAAASGSEGTTLCCWSVAELAGKPRTLSAGTSPIDYLAFRPDGQLIAASGSSVALWNFEGGDSRQLQTRIAVHALAIPTAEQLIVGDDEEREILIYGWDGQVQHELDEPPTG